MTLTPGYLFDLLRTLITREVRIRYKGSLLGVLWALLSPLGTVAIMQVLFTMILPLHIPHYAAFVYSGLLPWTWFQSAVQSGAATLLDNRDLVRKPFFPCMLLPAVVTGSNFLLYLLALPVLLILLLIEGIAITPALLLLPLVWLALALFTLACVIFVAAVGVMIRDLRHLLDVGMMLWFYLTPIFYDLDQVGASRARWFVFNPMTAPVEAHRAILLYGRMPDFGALGIMLVVGTVMLVISVSVFRALEDAFVEEV